MTNEISVIDEPLLLFGSERRLSDPHAGLSMFGPFDKEEAVRPNILSYAIIGTKLGVERFEAFAEMIQHPIIDNKSSDYEANLENERVWPFFPGFHVTYEAEFPVSTKYKYLIEGADIEADVYDLDPHKRVYNLVNLYLDKLKLIASLDEVVRVVVCVEPDVIWANCRPKSVIRSNATGSKVSSKELRDRIMYGGDLFGGYNSEQYEYAVDFRRQLKARAMAHKIPIQIIRESSLLLWTE